MALGSATELDYHLLLAHDLAYLQPQQYEDLASETQGVSRMLAAFIDTLRRNGSRNSSANSQQPIANSRG
jgi:four helix bundle protein